MEVFLRIDLNIFMAVVCAVIFFSSKNLTERQLTQNRVFRWLILTIIALLLLECMTWILDGVKSRGLLYLQEFDSMEHFKEELIAYLDYYNNRRIKVKLKGLPPALHRQQALLVA